ncbi:hypothetical protein GQ53DRAFT_202225 [Thozetella sp. PMI_491]|nr:hypothetical protein GQ53DRAFT_202225 [Thozetella sp. PMI_491]
MWPAFRHCLRKKSAAVGPVPDSWLAQTAPPTVFRSRHSVKEAALHACVVTEHGPLANLGAKAANLIIARLGAAIGAPARSCQLPKPLCSLSSPRFTSPRDLSDLASGGERNPAGSHASGPDSRPAHALRCWQLSSSAVSRRHRNPSSTSANRSERLQ